MRAWAPPCQKKPQETHLPICPLRRGALIQLDVLDITPPSLCYGGANAPLAQGTACRHLTSPGELSFLCFKLFIHVIKWKKADCYKGFVKKMLPLLTHMSIAKEKKKSLQTYYTYHPLVYIQNKKLKPKLTHNCVLFSFSKHLNASGYKKLFPVTLKFQSYQQVRNASGSTIRCHNF